MMAAMKGEFGVEVDGYWSYLATFNRECAAKGMTHDNLYKYREHFYNWTRRRMEINGKDGNKNKGKGHGDNQQQRQGGGDGCRNRRDEEIRGNVDNMLAKYGLTADDIDF